ncbi:MAG: hypothetical protein ACREQW_25025 [Candidatus Binatia bacterium]
MTQPLDLASQSVVFLLQEKICFSQFALAFRQAPDVNHATLAKKCKETHHDNYNAERCNHPALRDLGWSHGED